MMQLWSFSQVVSLHVHANFLIYFSEAKHYFLVILLELTLMFFWLNNTPGGCNGVSKVHYKGKQGEYYVMV